MHNDCLITARRRKKQTKKQYNQKHPFVTDFKNNINQPIIKQAQNDCRHLGAKIVGAHLQQEFIITGH